METLNNPTFWTTLVALVAAIWLMKRIANRQGYAQGVSHGFAYAIDEAANILVKHRLAARNDSPLTKEELVEILAPIAAANIIDKLKEKHYGKR